MSLIDIVKHIWQQLLHLFNKKQSDTQKAIHIGVIITEHIKYLINSPVADILTALIPGTLDDNLKQWLRLKLPVILRKFKLVQDTVDNNEMIKNSLLALKMQDDDMQKAYFHNLAIFIAQAASHNKLKWNDGVYLTEWYYTQKIKPQIKIHRDYDDFLNALYQPAGLS